MAVYLEFAVPGPPVSNQQNTPAGRANLATWRAIIAGAAALNWASPPLAGELRAIILNFYGGGAPSVDVDNLSKPILDAMQGIVYDNDRQIVQIELAHLSVGAPFSIMGVRPIVVMGLQAGDPFVYVRIEDPMNPFPLPK